MHRLSVVDAVCDGGGGGSSSDDGGYNVYGGVWLCARILVNKEKKGKKRKKRNDKVKFQGNAINAIGVNRQNFVSFAFVVQNECCAVLGCVATDEIVLHACFLVDLR